MGWEYGCHAQHCCRAHHICLPVSWSCVMMSGIAGPHRPKKWNCCKPSKTVWRARLQKSWWNVWSSKRRAPRRKPRLSYSWTVTSASAFPTTFSCNVRCFTKLEIKHFQKYHLMKMFTGMWSFLQTKYWVNPIFVHENHKPYKTLQWQHILVKYTGQHVYNVYNVSIKI